MSPTSFNCSPLRLVFLKSKEAKDRIDPYLIDSNKAKVKKAPVCVIIAMDIKFFNDLPRNFKAQDAKVFLKIMKSLHIQQHLGTVAFKLDIF